MIGNYDDICDVGTVRQETEGIREIGFRFSDSSNAHNFRRKLRLRGELTEPSRTFAGSAGQRRHLGGIFLNVSHRCSVCRQREAKKLDQLERR